jgi:hypothetical protein
MTSAQYLNQSVKWQSFETSTVFALLQTDSKETIDIRIMGVYTTTSIVV